MGTAERWQVLTDRQQTIERKVRARELVFGVQDGLISTVGLLSGVWAATGGAHTVIITGIAAAVTGGLSMATGSYLSAKTEKDLFEKELLDQRRLAEEQPYLAREALLESLVQGGLDRPSAYRVVQTMATREDLLLRTVQEKVLGLGSADLSKPLQAATVMFGSFLVGAAVPVLPFLALPGGAALVASWILAVMALLGVGIFKGLLTARPVLRSALEFACVALGSAVVGWGLGKLMEAVAGRPLPG